MSRGRMAGAPMLASIESINNFVLLGQQISMCNPSCYLLGVIHFALVLGQRASFYCQSGRSRACWTWILDCLTLATPGFLMRRA